MSSIISKIQLMLQSLKHGTTFQSTQSANFLPVNEAIIEPPNAPGREKTLAIVHSFAFWYHRIYLGNGIYTLEPGPSFPEIVWHKFCPAFPDNLQGASILDIGCNAGYFSIQAKLRGAGRVVGLESISDYLKQAEICREIWGVDIEYMALDAHQLDTLNEQFDIVIFTGILYHLKNPLQVLENVGLVCRDAVIVETEVISENNKNVVYVRQGQLGQTKVMACTQGIMKFVEKNELNGDGSNWWVPDTECVKGMLRTAGFKYFSKPYYSSENRLLLIAAKNEYSTLDLKIFG